MKSIRIGPFDYELKVLPEMHFNGSVLWGRIEYPTATIEIAERLQVPQREQTMWHEILHALLTHAGMTLENEEMVVEMLSHGIVQVLRDNEGLMS